MIAGAHAATTAHASEWQSSSACQGNAPAATTAYDAAPLLLANCPLTQANGLDSLAISHPPATLRCYRRKETL